VTTTSAAIRDACLDAIEALTPISLAGDRFERHTEDRSGGMTFEDWLEAKTGQMRRVSMLDNGDRTPPSVSYMDVIRERVTFAVAVAYPLSNRYGLDGGRSLETVIDEDERQISQAIGLHGSANIPSTAVFIVEASRWGRAATPDYVFLIGTLTFEFWLSTP
jgi:hypothetical protein